MSIAKRIEEAIRNMGVGDVESALIPTSIAVDATASQEYPAEKNNVAYKRFISENLALITRIAFGGVAITSAIWLQYDHPDLRPSADGLCSLEQIMYHVVRCGLLHDAKLAHDLQFVWDNTIRVDPETNSLVLPASLIYGLLVAVVVSPANARETAKGSYRLEFCGCSIALDRLWGKKAELFDLIADESAA